MRASTSSSEESSSSEVSSSSSEEVPKKAMFSLALGAVTKLVGPSYHDVASNFATVDVIVVCPNGKSLPALSLTS